MQRSSDISIIRADERHTRDFGWLRTSWLFSFDDYRDPNNVSFGVLRVFNDDLIAPGKGFPDHRHSEKEIVTYVLEGELTHEDSAGHKGVVRDGEVQRMTAGRGVVHSEFNRGNVPVHLYQIWFHPREEGLEPSYEKMMFPHSDREDRLQPLASGLGAGGVEMSADATLYACSLSKGSRVAVEGGPRRVFVYMTEGRALVNGIRLERNDQARVVGDVAILGEEDSELVVIDMPEMQ